MGYHVTILKTANGKEAPISWDDFVEVSQKMPDVAINEEEKSFGISKDGELLGTGAIVTDG